LQCGEFQPPGQAGQIALAYDFIQKLNENCQHETIGRIFHFPVILSEMGED
jgi:hypothetical protein